MLPKLHKSQENDEIKSSNHEEYLQITHEIKIDSRTILARCTYYINGLSLLVHKILESCLKEISYILKDTFDFKNKKNTNLLIGTVLGIVDIKRLYTKISYNSGLKSFRYLLQKLQDIYFHYFPNFQLLFS